MKCNYVSKQLASSLNGEKNVMVISAVFLSFLFIFFSLFPEHQKARGGKRKKVMAISAIIIIIIFLLPSCHGY